MAPCLRRVVIEGVAPRSRRGVYPIKRTVGEDVEVDADIFADGHDALAAVLLLAQAGAAAWTEIPWRRWATIAGARGCRVIELATYEFTVEAWVDRLRDLAAGVIEESRRRPGRRKRTARGGGDRRAAACACRR